MNQTTQGVEVIQYQPNLDCPPNVAELPSHSPSDHLVVVDF